MYTIKYLFYSSFYIKLIVLFLVIMISIVVCMGMSKIKKIILIKQYIQSFEEQFWSGIDLQQFYEANHENNLNHPLGIIFKAVFEEWKANEQLQKNVNLRQDIKERLLNVANSRKISILRVCENYMDALSTFIHLSPFLGLLGTVLGLIDVFYNLDLEHGVTLTNASIGIGGSLVCLVFSIIVVIIAMPMFWFFNMKIQEVSDKMDDYIIDLLHFFYRNLDSSVSNIGDFSKTTNVSSMTGINDNTQTVKEVKKEQVNVSSSADDDI